jgi:hypothetical protein
MDQTKEPETRGRGRPALPKEAHRRRLTVRFHPALLCRLETAAAKARHSLTQEIEERCAMHEGLLALSYKEAVRVLKTAGLPMPGTDPPVRIVDAAVDDLIDSLHHILSITIRNRGRPAEEQETTDDARTRYWHAMEKLEGHKS